MKSCRDDTEDFTLDGTDKESIVSTDELVTPPKLVGSKRSHPRESPKAQFSLSAGVSPMSCSEKDSGKKDKRNIKGLSIAIPKHNKFIDFKVGKNVYLLE